MLDLRIEELIFVVAAIGGGTGLVLRGLGTGVTRPRVVGAGGLAPLVPSLFAFIAMFGVGGLVASRVLDVHGVQAIVAASGAGVVAIGLAVLLRGTERRVSD